MQRILSNALPAHAGSTAQIQGWVHRRRELKSVAFLIVRDRAGLAQVVVRDPAVRARLRDLPEETVVAATGRVEANPAAPGGVELIDPRIEALSGVDDAARDEANARPEWHIIDAADLCGSEP